MDTAQRDNLRGICMGCQCISTNCKALNANDIQNRASNQKASLLSMFSECFPFYEENVGGGIQPNLLCGNCVENVRVIYKTRLQFENSYKHLKMLAESTIGKGELIADLLNDLSFCFCDICTEKCPTYAALKTHHEDKHIDAKIKCDPCSRVYVNLNSCVERFKPNSSRDISDEKAINCSSCLDILRGNTNSDLIKREESMIEGFSCSSCKKFFPTDQLNYHDCTNFNKNSLIEEENEDKTCHSDEDNDYYASLCQDEISLGSEDFQHDSEDLEKVDSDIELNDNRILPSTSLGEELKVLKVGSKNSDTELKPLGKTQRGRKKKGKVKVSKKQPSSKLPTKKMDRRSQRKTLLGSDDFQNNSKNCDESEHDGESKADECATSICSEKESTMSKENEYAASTCSEKDSTISNDKIESNDEKLRPLRKTRRHQKSKEVATAVKTECSSKSPQKKSNPQCNICHKIFSRNTHMKRHYLTHSDVKPLHCSVCSKGFTRQDHLNVHMLIHLEKKPFHCEICDRGFTRKEHLQQHFDNRHGGKKKFSSSLYTAKCEICYKEFKTAKYLSVHMKRHTDRMFQCKFCTKRHSTKAELNEHVKTHDREKPFLCSVCGHRFIRNDFLVIHMRRHQGEKPYKCRFCDKGFPRSTDRTVHERYHTGERSHLCTICGKGFQRAYNLIIHNRTHTGERPFKCTHCSRSFTQGNDLKAHIRRHTGERFKCDICDEGFIQLYHLTHHKKIVHGVEVKSNIHRLQKFTPPAKQQKQLQPLQEKISSIHGNEGEQNALEERGDGDACHNATTSTTENEDLVFISDSKEENCHRN